ncbi:hypothetical protein RQP53_05310 [Paucibacter sp. APW11]|uniref:Methyl-accepting transducer domain-containing protein n=1 Tax=Roseateles aquae TaxID=3077235 RepID=A0ABU3P8Z4_9BURK|nr:methyl-accepting chemotaxis protein [Paucibacter sp. APW11]MDT8998685.1 hypothetical protein [Paucibacter sp. APW11]
MAARLVLIDPCPCPAEVPELAPCREQSAREIKTLTTVSVNKVERGSQLVQEAGRTIGEVVQSMQRVARIATDFSQSTSTQALTLGEIGQAVTQLGKMTQQNASLVEQSAAAAESRRDLTTQLVTAVFSFRLRG